jgi:hypothetical protein
VTVVFAGRLLVPAVEGGLGGPKRLVFVEVVGALELVERLLPVPFDVGFREGTQPPAIVDGCAGAVVGVLPTVLLVETGGAWIGPCAGGFSSDSAAVTLPNRLLPPCVGFTAPAQELLVFIAPTAKVVDGLAKRLVVTGCPGICFPLVLEGPIVPDGDLSPFWIRDEGVDWVLVESIFLGGVLLGVSAVFVSGDIDRLIVG